MLAFAQPLEAREEADSSSVLTDAQMEAYIRAAADAREAAATCDVTLDLDGGSISGLSADGWIQGTEADTWAKTFDTGEGLQLSSPVRHGYAFLGWDANADGGVDVQPEEEYAVPTGAEAHRRLEAQGL